MVMMVIMNHDVDCDGGDGGNGSDADGGDGDHESSWWR
jgi:hypothetical protein